MRVITSIVLALLVLSIGLHDVMIRAAFAISQNYIAQNHCVNKLQPASNCFGSCQLKYMLDQNQDREADATAPLSEERQSPTQYCQQFTQSEAASYGNSGDIAMPLYQFELPGGTSPGVFHPPKC